MDKIMFLIILNIGLLIIISNSVIQLKKDIKCNRAYLNEIGKQVGVTDVCKTFQRLNDDKLKDFIKEGKTTKAVKRYREITGMDLKESYDYINKVISDKKYKA